jgi:hypothetical protein
MDRVFHGFSSKNGGFFVEICDNTKCDLQLSNTHTHAWNIRMFKIIYARNG